MRAIRWPGDFDGWRAVGSETRCLRALSLGHAKWGCGSQFYSVPAFILGAIESLVGGLNHLLGQGDASTWLGYADADRDGKAIGQMIGSMTGFAIGRRASRLREKLPLLAQ